MFGRTNRANQMGCRLIRGVGGPQRSGAVGAGTTLKTLARRRAGVRVLDRKQVCSLVRQAVGGALAEAGDSSPENHLQIENESCKRFEELLEDFRNSGAAPEAVPDGTEAAYDRRLVRYESVAELSAAIAGAVRAGLQEMPLPGVDSRRTDELERRLDRLMHSLEETRRALEAGTFRSAPRHAARSDWPHRNELTEAHLALMNEILEENLSLRDVVGDTADAP